FAKYLIQLSKDHIPSNRQFEISTLDNFPRLGQHDNTGDRAWL
ncbi:24054_t:CDS:2, partial [Racocetra persica]